jgi:transposase-like protein
MTKRQFTAEFKTKIVVELLREEQSLNEIATKNDISPNQLRNWKKEFLENASKAFSNSKQEREEKQKAKAAQEERQDLMAKVCQLTIENDWLKKKSVQVFGPDYEKKFSKRQF